MCGSQYIQISPFRLLFIYLFFVIVLFLPFPLFPDFSVLVYMLYRMLFISSQLVFPHQQNCFSSKPRLCLHFIFVFLNFLFLAEQKAIEIVFLVYSNNHSTKLNNFLTCLFLTKRNKLYI